MDIARSFAAAALFGAVPAFAQAASAPEAPARPELRAELLKMKDVDQAARQAAIEANFKDAALNQRMTDVDRVNTRRLRAIVGESGWPAASMVGPDGASAAWLLVQHADLDVDFQERCLNLMAPLAAADEASKKDLAYLTDRVLVNRRRPQRYGTQWDEVDGDFVLKPTEDPERLDERRGAVGLDTVAQS